MINRIFFDNVMVNFALNIVVYAMDKIEELIAPWNSLKAKAKSTVITEVRKTTNDGISATCRFPRLILEFCSEREPGTD